MFDVLLCCKKTQFQERLGSDQLLFHYWFQNNVIQQRERNVISTLNDFFLHGKAPIELRQGETTRCIQRTGRESEREKDKVHREAMKETELAA